jgi:formylglycine-generating enzyme required for sulfatase activity
MRRRETVLVGLAISSVAIIAASCALNAGAIVYVVADSGATGNDSGDVTLPDGAIVTPDGSIVSPDGGPIGKCASDQVDLDAGFCIDSTEVTNAKYLAFLVAVGADAGRDFAGCIGDNITPNNDNNELFSSPTLPVRGVDWCAARAYCKWAGKRLCGTIADGGEIVNNGFDFKDAAASEWDFACTQNGTLLYPYGNTEDASACNGSDLKEGGVVPVGSLPGCVGGYPGIHDMSGNVWEWENSCADDTSPTASCNMRGGSYFEGNIGVLRCDNNNSGTPQNNRNAALSNIGIRCCSAER